ncbi:CPBP family intramembrane glutamic endopeptidase [Clostridium sp.]|uniref:CPBP family intramembrane glutamic endopeptidase n=1 Tax=Clostridium sp. TaxID=1506 RepID=UPI003D6D3431
MKKIFTNRNSQVRSGFKIATTFGSAFIANFIISMIIVILLAIIMISTKKVAAPDLQKYLTDLTATNTGFIIFMGIIQCICMILAVWLFWKLFDKKPIREIGLINIKRGYKDLFKGLLFGSVSMTLVFIILLTSKNISLKTPLSSPNFNISLLAWLVMFILVGINEELFSRGYCMTVLKQTGNKWVVVIVSSIIFSLMHSLNPSMSIISYLNLFLVAILFAYMFLKSNNLWLPIGYHITWNYFQGNIFGFEVSGLATDSLYKLNTPVKNIITGGAFGPEGGLVVTFIIMLGFIYMWKIYKPQLIEVDNQAESINKNLEQEVRS